MNKRRGRTTRCGKHPPSEPLLTPAGEPAPRSFPLRSLRVRSLWVVPLAHLPLPFPCERRPRFRFD